MLKVSMHSWQYAISTPASFTCRN